MSFVTAQREMLLFAGRVTDRGFSFKAATNMIFRYALGSFADCSGCARKRVLPAAGGVLQEREAAFDARRRG